MHVDRASSLSTTSSSNSSGWKNMLWRTNKSLALLGDLASKAAFGSNSSLSSCITCVCEPFFPIGTDPHNVRSTLQHCLALCVCACVCVHTASSFPCTKQPGELTAPTNYSFLRGHFQRSSSALLFRISAPRKKSFITAASYASFESKHVISTKKDHRTPATLFDRTFSGLLSPSRTKTLYSLPLLCLRRLCSCSSRGIKRMLTHRSL